MNKKGSQPQQTNMAEDIIWCIQELIKQLAEVIFLLLKFGGKFVLKRYFKVRFKDPIVMKDLKSKKKDDCHDTLGWMVMSISFEFSPLFSFEYSSHNAKFF